MMAQDAELLRQYVAARSEEAFAELVRVHVNLVYGAALRQLGGDAHRAQEVTQSVFSHLARAAGTLTDRSTLAGWLHTTTRHVTATTRRADRTRERLERAAGEQQARLENEPGIAWERLRPTIDEVLHELDDQERDVVLLRYFEGRPFAEVGAAFGVSPDAARMRVERALEKLRPHLTRRGIASTATAIALALESAAASVVPAGLAGTLTETALAGAGATAMANGAGAASFFQGAHLSTATTVVAALVALGAAWFEGHRAQMAETEVAARVAERDEQRTRVRELTTKIAAASRENATRTAPAAPVPLPVVAAPEGSPDAEAARALEAGREFLAAHPEAQQLLARHARAQAEAAFTGLRTLGLTPDEYERAIAESLKKFQVVVRLGDLALPFPTVAQTPETINLQRRLARAGEQPARSETFGDGQWPEFLGEARLRQLRDYNYSLDRRSLVSRVAAATFDTGAPLTSAQARALYDIVQQSSGGNGVSNFDRDGALQNAGGVLSPLQLAAFNAQIVQRGLMRSAVPAAAAKK